MRCGSMHIRNIFLLFVAFALSGSSPCVAQQQTQVDTGRGDELVTEYFRRQTRLLTERTFVDIHSLEDWQSRRGEYRRQLFEMLGLDPLPDRTPLSAQVTGRSDHDGFVVENLHFQSRPGLYVTANLYRPSEQSEPLPAVLYVCGHGRVKKDGISYGNKVNYQHHGAWFARNGYVCLTIDTIQLGEIEGIHHGTYREKMWWWNNRGYTPAGVEAWNCIRSLDYLQSRKEVDGDRIGVTGRSGGGAYSWWVAALDDRIQAAVPVAGITSLHNHVVDGCVEGHCDCMYMVNTYRWDYPMVAALVAPRPLLISNTDKDRIFPLDGVVDVHSKVRKIYELYDAGDKLGLHITEGPHKDTQELRVHAFRWLNRFLKNDDQLIEKTAVKFFEPEQMKVFQELPDDEIVTTVHESFVPAASAEETPPSDAFAETRDGWMKSLRKKTFRGWPKDGEIDPLDPKVVSTVKRDGVIAKQIELTSQQPYRLSMFAFRAADQQTPSSHILFSVVDQSDWDDLAASLAELWPDRFTSIQAEPSPWQSLAKRVKSQPSVALVFFAPRGVGLTEWNREAKKRTQIRRRFMQLGQTAATMQIWDIRRALQALDQIDEFAEVPRHLFAQRDAAAWSTYASLFEPRLRELTLVNLPTRNRDAPDLLNVSRFVEMPQLLLMAADRAEKVQLITEPPQLDLWNEIKKSDIEPAKKISVTPASTPP